MRPRILDFTTGQRYLPLKWSRGLDGMNVVDGSQACRSWGAYTACLGNGRSHVKTI